MSNEKTLKEIILAEVQAVLDSYPDFTAEDATDNILDEVKALRTIAMENKIDIGYLRALLYAGCPEISIEEQSALSNAIKAMESMDKLIQERDSVWKTAREQYQFDLGMETRELKAKIADLESKLEKQNEQ